MQKNPSFQLNQLRFFFLACFFLFQTNLQAQDPPPNILLIIADDLGTDAINGYHQSNLLPTTPTLDSLRSVGITFENTFATPKCATSRATMMTGKYGIHNGVLGVPGNLDLTHTSIFKALETQTNNQYADAAIGKWHISHPVNNQHPLDHGADYFKGLMSSGPSDYYAWEKTENGVTTIDSTYITTALTDASIDWIDAQTTPWLLWLAHCAPHSPIHEPPSHMYTISPTGSNKRKYFAMIEALDYEVNRLLHSMSDSVRDNTLVIFVGDNGTPGNVIQEYPTNHGKSTLYQGGVRVPLIIAGAGVTRKGERESALVHITDIFATILEVAGADLPGGIHNSLSFQHLFTNDTSPNRDYNYTEFTDMSLEGWTLRGPQYKLIEYASGTQEMYDLLVDSLELNDLILGTLTQNQLTVKADLEAEALQIRTAWSCRDHIQNGDEDDIDCGGSHCIACVPNSIDPNILVEGITVYPNPGSDQFHLHSESHAIQAIRVFNSVGELLIAKDNLYASEETIDIRNLSAQLLFIEVTVEEGRKMVPFIKR